MISGAATPARRAASSSAATTVAGAGADGNRPVRRQAPDATSLDKATVSGARAVSKSGTASRGTDNSICHIPVAWVGSSLAVGVFILARL